MDIFNGSKKKLYDEIVNPNVILNIKGSEQFWMGTGFENLADDIFKD